MKISIFGLGYVGCVSGACFADMGHEVVGVEPNPVKVALINDAKPPIVEMGLEARIQTGVRAKRFRATGDWQQAIAGTELAIVCVGTPSNSNQLEARARWLRRAASSAGCVSGTTPAPAA